MQEPATEFELASRPETALSVEVVKTEVAFDRLKEAWDKLVGKSDCTIYQTFEWQRTWWKYFGRGRQLHCLVFTRDTEVLGIAPLYREKVRLFGIPFAAAMRVLGSEEADYSDVLVAPENRHKVLKAFASYLHNTASQFDFFEIRDVSEATQTMQMLPDVFRDSGFKVYTYKGSVCPQVNLPSTWPEFLQHLGGNLRYQLKKKTDRLKKNYKVEFELAGDKDEEVETALREFAVIHGNRWESLGYLNAFKDRHFLAFHTEVSQKFARRGWLRMFFLTVNGDKVAVNFDFNFRKRIYFYHGNAYGPPEVMKYSPGFLLRCAAIEKGIEEGMEIYDMLRGDETYKANDFKCVPVGNWQIRAVLPGGLRSVRFKIFVLSELLRKIPKRLRREYQDFRRFSKTKDPSFSMLLGFIWSEIKELLGLVKYTLSRFFPSSRH